MMAEPPLTHSFAFTRPESGRLDSVEPLSNLSGTHPHPRPRNPHLPLPPQYASDWRPTTVEEFNTWNASPQGMFPLALVGPGQNPNPLPHPQPVQLRDPPRPDTAATNGPSHGKRKRATPLGSVEASPVGAYGPLLPERDSTGSPGSSPPLVHLGSR